MESPSLLPCFFRGRALLDIGWRQRKAHGKRRALSLLATGSNGPLMCPHQLLDDEEAEAEPSLAPFRRLIGLVEWREDAVYLCGGKPRAVVGDFDLDPIPLALCAHLHSLALGGRASAHR